MSICLYCRHLAAFNKDMTLRELSDDETLAAAKDPGLQQVLEAMVRQSTPIKITPEPGGFSFDVWTRPTGNTRADSNRKNWLQFVASQVKNICDPQVLTPEKISTFITELEQYLNHVVLKYPTPEIWLWPVKEFNQVISHELVNQLKSKERA